MYRNWTQNQILTQLLEHGLAHLPAAQQVVYLRCFLLAGMQPGTCQVTQDRLVRMTGLSRGTVLAALRELTRKQLVEVIERGRKKPTTIRVNLPEGIAPQPSRPATDSPGREWKPIVDLLSPEDRRHLDRILDSLSEAERSEMYREAVRLLAREDPGGIRDPDRIRKAMEEVVLLRRFGPARLARYLLVAEEPDLGKEVPP